MKFFFFPRLCIMTQKIQSDVYFCQPEPEILYNPEKSIFLIIEGYRN